jgi:hypothetical protein
VEYVCNISNYGTFGLKSGLLDIARVLSENRIDVLNVNKKLTKNDEEGDPLTWESANDECSEFREYMETHPRVAEVTKGLMCGDIDWEKFGYKNPPNRKRGMGMHASGLVISGAKLGDFVPMVVSSGNREKGLRASAWVEGLADTDLSSQGFIKFDFLSLEANAKIAACNRLIMNRHPVTSICALEGMANWSDTSYLDDKLAIELANRGDLRGIFQFDSDGIRKMVKSGGVSGFEDLAAYSSLYRPGPITSGMHEEFIDRKKGLKEWVVPQTDNTQLTESLTSTYGVLCYQEQIMLYLSVVGKIPIAQCQGVIKAISKKKVEKFKKYKEEFVRNAQITLVITEDEANARWTEIENWAGYGFNRSILDTTLIPVKVCGNWLQKEIKSFIAGDIVLCIDENGDTVETVVVDLHDHGLLEGYEVTFDDGYKVTCTLDHKFLTNEGQKSLREIVGSNSVVLSGSKQGVKYVNEKFVGISMWDEFSQSQGNVFSHDQMRRVSSEKTHDWRMECQMRSSIQNEVSPLFASAELSRLQEIGLENDRNRWSNDYRPTCSEMRFNFRYGEKERKASKNMRTMRCDQANQHYVQKFENQSIRGASFGVIQSCQIDICKAGNSRSQSEQFAKVARSQSRETCHVFGGDVKESEKFKDGEMGSSENGLGYGTDKVWGVPKASGFCQRKYLDRSGRIFSFPRVPAFQKDLGDCSEKRCDVESRSDSARRCHASEIEYGMFRVIDRSNEDGVLGLVPEHAEIAYTGGLVSRKIVRIMSVGKRKMYDLEVANPTHNFLLPNGIVTSNSHSTAYTYVSSRQLWQKAHYPIEFFAEDLAHLKTADDRILEYIDDASRRGLKTNRLHLNKSGVNFEIVSKAGERGMPAAEGDEIYYGFNKIKGIGDESAERIVAGQPYTGFVDFLQRFGTDAKVVQPLIALGVFEEDPVILFKYYESFKTSRKKEDDRGRRNVKSLAKYREELKSMVVEVKDITFDEVDFSKARPYVDVAKWKAMGILKKKYDRCVAMYSAKTMEAQDVQEVTTLADFKHENIEIEEEMETLLKSKKESEIAYYGFEWDHPLMKLKDYTGLTWSDAHMSMTKDSQVCPVEVVIKQVDLGETKTGKPMLKMRCEDASRQVVLVTAWSEEIERFGSVLKVGACVRMRVKIQKAEGEGYWHNVESYGWKDKKPSADADFRVFVMKK